MNPFLLNTGNVLIFKTYGIVKALAMFTKLLARCIKPFPRFNTNECVKQFYQIWSTSIALSPRNIYMHNLYIAHHKQRKFQSL